jgi:hypothetical protein
VDLERLIALIVKSVVEELARQGLIQTEERPETAAPAASKPAPGTRRVVSARMVLEAAGAGRLSLDVPCNALITPLASDVAREKGITIRRMRE